MESNLPKTITLKRVSEWKGLIHRDRVFHLDVDETDHHPYYKCCSSSKTEFIHNPHGGQWVHMVVHARTLRRRIHRIKVIQPTTPLGIWSDGVLCHAL